MKALRDDYKKVEESIGYHFRSTSLLFQAFTRISYATEHNKENNEVLEFIGDRVIDYYVTKALTDKYGYITKKRSLKVDPGLDGEFVFGAKHNEGDFTILKQEIVCNDTLAKMIDMYGFNEYLFLGKNDLKNHKELDNKIKADLFEAIIGAVAIDSDWDSSILENVIYKMLNLDKLLEESKDIK